MRPRLVGLRCQAIELSAFWYIVDYTGAGIQLSLRFVHPHSTHDGGKTRYNVNLAEH